MIEGNGTIFGRVESGVANTLRNYSSNGELKTVATGGKYFNQNNLQKISEQYLRSFINAKQLHYETGFSLFAIHSSYSIISSQSVPHSSTLSFSFLPRRYRHRSIRMFHSTREPQSSPQLQGGMDIH